MATKTLRMDPEDEARLERVRRKTGWTASDVLKEGVRLLDERLASTPGSAAYQIYSRLDLGPGGYASGPATNSREAAREAILRRRQATKT
jgi:hypothetical protein